MVSSPLKRKVPLQENQPERKKSKLSNREKHVFVSKWLSLNYQIDCRNYTALSGILDYYNVSSCEKENFVLNAKEMGMILSEVFPEATRVQQRENGYRTWKYPLSKKPQLDEEALKWEDLPHFTKEFAGRPPLGQMPFIVTPEGKVLAQSGAIMKYICKKGGLSPADSFDEVTADMISDGVTDLRQSLIKIHFEKDEAKKEELKKEFFETTLPARLEKYLALLKSRNEGKGFFLGDKLTYADIAFFDLFNGWLAEGKPEVPEQLNKFPLLVEHYNRVLNVPEIKAWVEKRPESSF